MSSVGSQAPPPVTPRPSTRPEALSRYHLGVGQLGRPRPPPRPAPSSGPAPPCPAPSRLSPRVRPPRAQSRSHLHPPVWQRRAAVGWRVRAAGDPGDQPPRAPDRCREADDAVTRRRASPPAGSARSRQGLRAPSEASVRGVWSRTAAAILGGCW